MYVMLSQRNMDLLYCDLAMILIDGVVLQSCEVICYQLVMDRDAQDSSDFEGSSSALKSVLQMQEGTDVRTLLYRPRFRLQVARRHLSFEVRLSA